MTSDTGIMKGVSIEDLDTSKFVDEETGFYPYWSPTLKCKECGKTLEARAVVCKEHPTAKLVGNRFYGRPVSVSERIGDDGKPWTQYLVQSLVDMRGHCRKGPKDDDEFVDVLAGDFFNVSHYEGMQTPKFFTHAVLVSVKGKKQGADTKKNPAFIFSVAVDESTKAIFDKEREELVMLARRQHAAKRLQLNAIGEGKLSNSNPAA